MSEEAYRVCPECAGEFRLEILTCPDCEVPLLLPEEIADRAARERALSAEFVPVLRDSLDAVRDLARKLDARGIHYHVDRRSVPTLWVRREDEATVADLLPHEEEDPDAHETADRPSATYKVCPECGGEFRLDVESCIDCDVALVHPDESENADPGDSANPKDSFDLDEKYYAPKCLLPPGEGQVCVCCGAMRGLRSVSTWLDAAGIFHRIESVPDRNLKYFRLVVEAADRERAAALDAEAGGGVPIDEVATAELGPCPACGTPRDLGALSCAECGLTLGFEELLPDPICGGCGARCGSDFQGLCPNCGTRLAVEAESNE